MRLLDFYSPGCGPCKAMSEMLEKVLPTNYPQVELVKIDANTLPDDYMYDIRTVPTLVLEEKNSHMIKYGYMTEMQFKEWMNAQMRVYGYETV